jgi:DNA-binding NtrC family response regulator
MTTRRILLVDDEPEVRLPLRRYFEKKGYAIEEVGTVAAALTAFAGARPDLVLLDYGLPDGNGVTCLKGLKELDASVPMIMLTAHGSIELAVQAIKDGAEQFFTKPVELPALEVVIGRILENDRIRHVTEVSKSQRARRSLDPFVGESPAIRQLAEQASRVATATTPVVILGETGSGKGVLARWLHENGPRSGDAFVDLNCAGLSRELLESELFGYQKGAFTGATASKPGLMEMAHRGTLFLDEVGDVDLLVQAKLLKVIEDMRIRRLGDVQDRQVDVRLIAATHRDLAEAVREEKFREDLYFRICRIPLRIPPLRERGADLVVLARQILERVSAEMGRGRLRLSGEAEKALYAHSWPGNVRELRNVLEHASLFSKGDVLQPDDFRESWKAAASPRAEAPQTLDEAEKVHIESMLRLNNWAVPRTAEVLGISRTALYDRIRKHGIQLPQR